MVADKKQNPIKFGEVVAKCWEDEAYKKRFIEDPESVLSEAGFVVEEGVTYKVIEQPKLVKYLVIPHENAKDAVQLLAKGFLNQAESKDVIIPEGVEIPITDVRHGQRRILGRLHLLDMAAAGVVDVNAVGHDGNDDADDADYGHFQILLRVHGLASIFMKKIGS